MNSTWNYSYGGPCHSLCLFHRGCPVFNTYFKSFCFNFHLNKRNFKYLTHLNSELWNKKLLRNKDFFRFDFYLTSLLMTWTFALATSFLRSTKKLLTVIKSIFGFVFESTVESIFDSNLESSVVSTSESIFGSILKLLN